MSTKRNHSIPHTDTGGKGVNDADYKIQNTWQIRTNT